jgi:ABC-type multidrug transport system ATPase subunit
MSAVVYHTVSRRFGETLAVDRLDLEVEKGTVTVLLGANGAGKTTTIRMATGVIRPDAGGVEVLGMDPATRGEEVRRVCGVVPPKPAMYDRLTGRANLRYAARLYDIADPPIEREAERFGIGGVLDRPVSGYSTGMRTRLALARAMLHEPRVLLLDEPTAGLDPEAAEAVRRTVLDSAAMGATVILSTHLLNEADGAVDQVVLMDSGRVWERGTPGELAARYLGDGHHVLDAEDRGALLAWLGSRGIGVVETDPPVVAVGRGVADLVAAAVGAGIRLTRVEPRRITLERLYREMRRAHVRDGGE